MSIAFYAIFGSLRTYFLSLSKKLFAFLFVSLFLSPFLIFLSCCLKSVSERSITPAFLPASSIDTFRSYSQGLQV
ncbi:hypothetical protein HR10_09295 [Porphyromonas gulae]|nr:hypothetical protein HR10_09295 [Porphyromonas gulae]